MIFTSIISENKLHLMYNFLLKPYQVVMHSCLVMILLFSHAFSEAQEEHVLRSVTIPGAPIIIKDKDKNKKIMYGLDLIFDRAPKDFWVYYSKNIEKLVVDFYGINIKGKLKTELSDRGVFKSVAIKTHETNLALSKKRAVILIDVKPDPEWHFKASSINPRVIRVTAWKDITGLTQVKRKRKTAGRYIVITLLVSVLTLVGVVAISRNQ